MDNQAIQRAKSKVEPETLYHYTTQAGLIGILDKECIWATHIRYLNDTNEGKIVSRVIFDEITSRYRLGRAFEELGIRVDDIPKSDEAADVETLNFGSAMTSWVTSQSVFATSFSEKGDSLGQWRAYSGSTGGYSIGFKTSYLREAGNHYLATRGDRFSSSDALTPCIYYDREVEEAFESEIKDLVSTYLTEAASIAALPKHGGREEYSSPTSIALRHFTQLGRLSAIYKDEGFKEEAEWRLAFVRDRDLSIDLKIRQGGSMLIPYLEVPLRWGDRSLVMQKIVIGPCPHPTEAIESVKMLLRSKGIVEVDVVSSKIPYRNW